MYHMDSSGINKELVCDFLRKGIHGSLQELYSETVQKYLHIKKFSAFIGTIFTLQQFWLGFITCL